MTEGKGEAKQEQMKKAVGDMRSLLGSTGNQAGWDKAWKQGLTPWEIMLGNVAQPALRWACEEEPKASSLIPNAGRALVPGCGRGQDVAYLAVRGLDALGVDISESAVEAAKTWLGEQKEARVAQHADVMQADYFDLSTGPGTHPALTKLDLVYDYTFFCAIPAELHAKWADAHAAALKPGGVLVCLVYPLRPPGDESTQGPPYFVTPAQYTALLQTRFTLVFEGAQPKDASSKKMWSESIMIWQRN